MVLRFAALPVRRGMGVVETDKPARRPALTGLSDFAHPNFLSNASSFTLDKPNHRFVFGHEGIFKRAIAHQACLLWLLNGDRLAALSENTAMIETRTGSACQGTDAWGFGEDRARHHLLHGSRHNRVRWDSLALAQP